MEAIITKMAECAARAGDEIRRKSILDIGAWLDRPEAHIVVCGEFNRGKSTLVNALLGLAICPTDMLPTTAIPMVFNYGESPQATIQLRNGDSRPIEPTFEALGMLSAGCQHPLDDVRLVNVEIPSMLLKKGIVLIDTPGVNDLSRQRAEVTYGFLPLADAALVLFDATAPITQSEIQFLKDQVLPNYLERVIFVLAKCDRLDSEELGEALMGARQRLKQQLGRDVCVLPVSALNALQGRTDNLGGIVEELERVRTRVGAERTALARLRLKRLASEWMDSIRDRMSIAQAGEDELSDVHLRAEQVRHEAMDNYGKFREYIDLYGRKTLKQMIDVSLKSVEVKLQEALIHHVDTLHGGVDEFMQNEVSYQVMMQIRRWCDEKGIEIDAFLRQFVERISHDYATAFAAPLELAVLPPRLVTPELSAVRRNTLKNQTEEFILYDLLPNSLPAIVGFFMMGGMGLIAGGMFGRVIGKRVHEDRLEKQQQEAGKVVRREIPLAIQTFRDAVLNEINRWFDRLQKALWDQLNERISQAQRLLCRDDGMSVSTGESLIHELEAIQNRLEGDMNHE